MNGQIFFETLGCRLNQIESESAARFFSDAGFSVMMGSLTASSPVQEMVILCIINTCAVTQKAEQKARREIRLVLEKCPNATVVVTGCYAQLNKMEIAALDKRIAVLPGQCKSRLADIPQLLVQQLAEGTFDAAAYALLLCSGLFAVPVQKLGQPESSFRLSTDTFLAHSRSSIKIQDGCNNACTYCTICIARGHSVSLDVQDVIDRITALENAGQSEVVFTTVNIAQYHGAYNGSYLGFTGLLAVLLEKTKRIAFRISSLYPELVDEQFCTVIADSRVRPHFHLSVQSGSDHILELMKRNYTASDVFCAVEKLKQAKRQPFLACDIIAGFPGETDEDFALTMDLVRACGFTWIHAFPFSARPGTPAYTMKPNVPQSEAGRRVHVLLDYAVQSKTAYISSYAGRTVEAVAEMIKRPGILHAVTENFIHCEIPYIGSSVPAPGNRIVVRIGTPYADRIAGGDEWEAEAALV